MKDELTQKIAVILQQNSVSKHYVQDGLVGIFYQVTIGDEQLGKIENISCNFLEDNQRTALIQLCLSHLRLIENIDQAESIKIISTYPTQPNAG